MLLRHMEWTLLINTLVEIRFNGQVLRTGFVDDAMPDSSALWIAADHRGPRQIFEACEGHEVWVAPRELSGELNYRMTTRNLFGTGSL